MQTHYWVCTRLLAQLLCYLFKVALHGDLQLLQVGRAQVTLQFAEQEKQTKRKQVKKNICRRTNEQLKPWRASPQSIFFLSALLLQLQDPLLQPIENLDRVTLNVSKHLTLTSAAHCCTGPGELTTLPSFFLSTKLRVYSDAFGEREALANGFFCPLPNIDSANILALGPAAPQSVSPAWHCLPPGGVVWLWFAGCRSFVLGGSEKKGNAFFQQVTTDKKVHGDKVYWTTFRLKKIQLQCLYNNKPQFFFFFFFYESSSR